MDSTPPITPVILCGGAGTRLWPLSRSASPKQLLALVGSATMLQATAARIPGRALIVTGAAHADAVAEQLAGLPHTCIIEPVARNTAPAIALAAFAAPDATLLVMPSDHVIADPGALRAAVAAALPAVAEGWLVTFGIAPDGPETGYGYIRRGAALHPGVFAVEAFVEKPDRARAAAMLKRGGHDWNGGIFLFRATDFLAELARQQPAMHAACAAAMAGAAADGDALRPNAAAFAACPADSIDYAVLEHAARVAVVPVSMGWSDIGSWDALRLAHHADLDGNVVHGPVVAVDTANCLLRSEGPVLAAVGVHGLNIVATGDAVLVTGIGQSQGVKTVVERLRGQAVLDRPARTRHGWGEAIALAAGGGVTVAEIVLRGDAVWPGLPRPAALVMLDGTGFAGAQALGPGDDATLGEGTSVRAGPGGARFTLSTGLRSLTGLGERA